MSSRQADGIARPTSLTVPPAHRRIDSPPVLPAYERSRYPGQLKVSCRMAGNVRAAGEPGPVYPEGKADLAPKGPEGPAGPRMTPQDPHRPGTVLARVPCCPEVATRRNAGANPGLSRNCDRG